MLETFYQSLRPGGYKDFLQRLVEQVAKDCFAVVVETARHQTAVCQHSYLLDQGFAEELLLVRT